MRIFLDICLLLLLIGMWYFVFKLIQFVIYNSEHPEEKQLLTLNNVIPDKKLSKLFKIFILGDLAFWVLGILVEPLLGFGQDSLILIVPGFIFFFFIFLLGILNLFHTVKNFRDHGLMPVVVALINIFVGGIASVFLFHMMIVRLFGLG